MSQPDPKVPGAAQYGGQRERRPLSEQEVRALIERNIWGVLSMAADNEPYAVPVIYGYDGDAFVFANGPGRKVDTLRRNPRVCLVITEVEDHGKVWRSVVVQGTVEWIESAGDRLYAFDLLRKQMPFTVQRLRDATKIATAPVARLVPSEITGRTAGN
jgi:nitroimidazol reductase NimA-like FMN-containing flavoprotein (pyridoxamine 5'-phosphate oxidase superfamily)